MGVSAVPRRRVGTHLLQGIFAQAEKHGIYKCRLNVHVKNEAAIALYKSLGFQIKDTLVGYYQRSAERLEQPPDAHLMQWDSPSEVSMVGQVALYSSGIVAQL